MYLGNLKINEKKKFRFEKQLNKGPRAKIRVLPKAPSKGVGAAATIAHDHAKQLPKKRADDSPKKSIDKKKITIKKMKKVTFSKDNDDDDDDEEEKDNDNKEKETENVKNDDDEDAQHADNDGDDGEIDAAEERKEPLYYTCKICDYCTERRPNYKRHMIRNHFYLTEDDIVLYKTIGDDNAGGETKVANRYKCNYCELVRGSFFNHLLFFFLCDIQ